MAMVQLIEQSVTVCVCDCALLLLLLLLLAGRYVNQYLDDHMAY